MRYNLVDKGGTRLGELMLAEGVTLQTAGIALMSGRPMSLDPVDPATPSVDGHEKPKDTEKHRGKVTA